MILPLIIHDKEAWTQPAPRPVVDPAEQPAAAEPTPPPAIAGPADISARRAACAECEHLATPAQCGCQSGLCRHPEASHPNLSLFAASACPLGRWQPIAQ